jgi:hypothetical protein
MRTETAAVGEDVVAVAPGVLKRVGQNGHRADTAAHVSASECPSAVFDDFASHHGL